MYKKEEHAVVFLIGGTIYTLIEMLWRGYSHYSMTIAGGACMLAVHLVNKKFSRKRSARTFALKCALCATSITAIELTVGVLVNIVLGLGVWDYSDKAGNIFGQICPAYSAAWLLLSAPALGLSELLGKFFTLIRERERASVAPAEITDIT